MEQAIHTKINWLDESQMITLIENAGFAVNGDNEDEVREEFREHVVMGNIDPESFMD